MKLNIRILYLYLFSFVGLIITVFGSVRLVELGLKVLVFKEADRYYLGPKPFLPDENLSTEEQKRRDEEWLSEQEKELTRQRQRELSGAISMVAVGLPLYLYHWRVINRENKNKQQ